MSTIMTMVKAQLKEQAHLSTTNLSAIPSSKTFIQIMHSLIDQRGNSVFDQVLGFCYAACQGRVDEGSLFLLRRAFVYKQGCLTFSSVEKNKQGVADLRFLVMRWILEQPKNFDLTKLGKPIRESLELYRQPLWLRDYYPGTKEKLKAMQDLNKSYEMLCKLANSRKQLAKIRADNQPLQEILNEELITAVKRGDCLDMCALLSLGLNLKLQDKEGMTLLHHAVEGSDQDLDLGLTSNNQEAAILILGIMGVEPNLKNKKGNTPLDEACDTFDFYEKERQHDEPIPSEREDAQKRVVQALIQIGAPPSERYQHHPALQPPLVGSVPVANSRLATPLLFSPSWKGLPGVLEVVGKRKRAMEERNAELLDPAGEKSRQNLTVIPVLRGRIPSNPR